MKYVTVFVFIFYLSGCATRPLDADPYVYIPDSVDVNHPEDYAIIRTLSERKHKVFAGLDQRVLVASLDDLSLFKWSWVSDYPEVSYLTEGTHEITLRYTYLNTYAYSCFSMHAKKGMIYTVRHSVKNRVFSYWIEAETVGKVPIGKCKPNSLN